MNKDREGFVYPCTLYNHCYELKVTYRPLYSMNKFVTNKSKSPQNGEQVFPYMG